VRRLVRLALVVGLAVWAWRLLVARRGPHERAGVSYADGSSLVLEPGSSGFERLAEAARPALAAGSATLS
jgi:hypothetical protein